MGNCVSQKRQIQANSMNSTTPKPIKHITVISDDSRDKADLFTNLMEKSPTSDKGDRCTNWVKTSPRFVSRIPVLTLHTRNRNLSKSTSFLRSSKSRIPVTLKHLIPNDTNQVLNNFSHPLHRSHSQLNESGFVSDFSVTNSGYSQVNMEQKSDKTRPIVEITDDFKQLKQADEEQDEVCPSEAKESQISVQVRSAAFKQPPSNSSSPQSWQQVKKASPNSSNRRPQSLSCESELLIQKLHNKRLSEIGTNPPSVSPFPIFSEHSGILQDVSQLKLMLHKLRRSLLHEPVEFIKQESLFRPDTPLCTDIKLMTREDLEQKYEKLVARNIHLERLLQSREKVIAQLQTVKDSSFEVYCRSPVETNPNEFFSHKNIKSISDIPPLQNPETMVN